MASAVSDSDLELGTDSGSENGPKENVIGAQGESQAPGDGCQGDEASGVGRKPQPSESKRQTEKTVRIETRTESIEGLDDLSSCINSVDDHVQAGLQELRNCVANLRRERTEMSEKLRTLSTEVFHVSSERDQCQHAIAELQQEVSILREQLCNQQQDKESLLRRMQEIQQRNQDHLVKIAGKQRNRRLAHNVIVAWRRKAFNRGLGYREQIRLLEEENNQLRAELLLCQEAAKQAFLRSANVLNSEAITMFQDAATRRLGFEETTSQGSQASHFSSPSESPVPHHHASQENENAGIGAVGDDKENNGKYRDGRNTKRTGDWERYHHGEREGPGNDGAGGSEDNRSFVATYGSDDQNNLNNYHGHYSLSNLHRMPRRSYREQEGYGMGNSDPTFHLTTNVRPPGTYHYDPRSEDLGAAAEKGPSQNRHPAVSGFEPNSLQQETRAYLQQLRDDRRRRPEPPVSTGFESQQKTQRTSTSHQDPKRRRCSCRSRVGTNATDVQMPYNCPYCTPVQNSSFGHSKDVGKKSSNVTRNTILSSTNTDKKKVLYKPSASTIVIEKHITR